ncbi:MAG TPA: alpha/beta hydrolase, partial [Burkholderiaceae bacterium]|nr:alpha/beta hydrolase [Burkholderiaceae bacterium]
SAPFAKVDLRNLPAAQRIVARDGTPLALRRYAAVTTPPLGSVVLVHGSSASSRSMHTLAEALAQSGRDVVALDMRGHGESGPRGRVERVGQLEDDVEDVMNALALPRPRTLVGFSSGGGFALRFASGPQQALFDGTLLLSPFLSQDAPTQRPDSGGWVSVGLPRYIALALLHQAGIGAFDHLPVTAFAVAEGNPANLTTHYDFALAQNFRPRPDYRADIRAARAPMAVLVGADDEAFHADRFAGTFAEAGKPVPVKVLPGLGHIALTLDPAALKAIVDSLDSLYLKGPAS